MQCCECWITKLYNSILQDWPAHVGNGIRPGQRRKQNRWVWCINLISRCNGNLRVLPLWQSSCFAGWKPRMPKKKKTKPLMYSSTCDTCGKVEVKFSPGNSARSFHTDTAHGHHEWLDTSFNGFFTVFLIFLSFYSLEQLALPYMKPRHSGHGCLS